MKSTPGRALHIFYFSVFEAKRDIGIRLRPRQKKREVKYSTANLVFIAYLDSLLFLSETCRCCSITVNIEQVFTASVGVSPADDLTRPCSGI